MQNIASVREARTDQPQVVIVSGEIHQAAAVGGWGDGGGLLPVPTGT